MINFARTGAPLSGAGLTLFTATAGVGEAELWTVVAVETSGCGFLADKRPVILFERHYFSRLTGHRYDAEYPEISLQAPGGYGASGAHQYDRLSQALALDESAALQSASWGLGQIMGANFAACGFASVTEMVQAMIDGEDGQLGAMARFLKMNGLTAALQRHDWPNFARKYNGPRYAENNYDQKLATAFSRYSRGPLPDLRVRAAQLLLTYRGFAPGGIDGVAGPRTTAAVQAFQTSTGLAADGSITDALIAALH